MNIQPDLYKNISNLIKTNINSVVKELKVIESKINKLHKKIDYKDPDETHLKDYNLALKKIEKKSSQKIEELTNIIVESFPQHEAHKKIQELVLKWMEKVFEPIDKLKKVNDELIKKHTKSGIIKELTNEIFTLDNKVNDIQLKLSFIKEDTPGRKELIKKREELQLEQTKIEKSLGKFVQEHYSKKTIRGDGNCMFRSIADQVKGDQDRYHEYRESAAHYIKNHKSFFQTEIETLLEIDEDTKADVDKFSRTLKDASELTTFDKYWQCMGTKVMWGGRIELMALSKALRKPILVFAKQEFKEKTSEETLKYSAQYGLENFGDEEPILLFLQGSNHYESLVAK